MPSKAKKPYYNVERRGPASNWYQVMLAPFETFEECLEYIQKYHKRYPVEEQNYRITYEQ